MPSRVSSLPRSARSSARRKLASSPMSQSPASRTPSPAYRSRKRPSAWAPPIGTTATPSASRSRPRLAARASTARRSLSPSTETTARTSVGEPVATNGLDDEFLGVRRRVADVLARLLRELVDAEHELHRVRRRLLRRLDDVAVHGEGDAVRRPLRGIHVRLPCVDRNEDTREIVDDRRIAEGMDAHPDARVARRDVATEDLDDADLGRPVGLVLVADHPERDHRARVVDRPRAELDAAVERRVEAERRLLLPYDGERREAVLADLAPDRSGEDARLQRGDADVT